MSITIKISDATDGKHAVYIDDELSHHVGKDDVAALLAETQENLWHTDPVKGAELGKKLYDMLNCGAGTLQGIIDAARGYGEDKSLYLQTPYELTQLPFELLNNGGFVLLNRNIHIIRLVEDRGERAQIELKKTPLKMLFMACSPMDLHPKEVLNFEKEEEHILNSTVKNNIDMTIEDTGSLEGLKEANIVGRFDIIHIIGHADLDKDMGSVFYMEDDIGRLKKVSPEDLWDAIKDNPPKLLFLSGCLTGSANEKANTESFAYKMAKNGVRWVLGWGLPVSDDGAMLMAVEIYRCLSIGKGLDYAVQSARRLVTNEDKNKDKDKYHPWPLLRLFGDRAPIVPLVVEGLPIRHVNPVKLRYTKLKDSDVMVLEEGFVGRRRYVQRGVSVLKGAAERFGLLVRGPAGIGKSCLVGKLVERFKEKKLVVFHGVLNKGDVSLKLRRLFDENRQKDGLAIINSIYDYEDKIRDLFHNVFKTPLSVIIYFDDFEQNLDRHGNQYYVKDEIKDIIRPFLEAVEWSLGNSNVIISSRYHFVFEHYGENLPATRLYDLTIRSFDGSDLDKKTRDLPSIANSPHIELYHKYGGGNPRLLELLDVIAKDEAKYDLTGIEAQLQGKQAEFIREYLADVIAKTVGDDFHSFIQRAAVYGEPVGADAFKGFGDGKSLEFLKTGVDLTLIEREDVARGEFVYWVTPVIADSMLGKLTDAERLEAHGRAYRWYIDWLSASPVPNYRYMEEAVCHALAVGNVRDACKYAHVLGKYFYRMVLYRQGRAIMEKVAVKVSDAVIDEAKAEKDGEVGNFLNEYALLLWKLGEAKQAIASYEKSLAIWLEVYGERHPDVAGSYNNIGEAWRALGEAKQAIAFYEKSLAIRLAVYGENHPDVAQSYNNIGLAWNSLGDAKQAIAFHEKSLAIRLEVYGKKHPAVAYSYNNIGSVFYTLGDAMQAIALFEKSLAIFLEVHGEKHPDVATAYSNLGTVWNDLGDSKQAIAFHEKALAILLKIYGERHPSVAISYNNIGETWRTLGDSKQAIVSYEKALAILLEFYGERHPNVSILYKNLANVYRNTGDTQKAADCTAKAEAAWS
ncbi:MAG: tetratricopeptide repeat protein [Nitrospirae bacterium]|nr:tetratricopeptide repeat protein [Nitrospirota bacterium]